LKLAITLFTNDLGAREADSVVAINDFLVFLGIEHVMRALFIFIIWLSPSLAAAQSAQPTITDVTFILEDGVQGLGIKVDLSEWIDVDAMSRMATDICMQVAPEALRRIQNQGHSYVPAFIEVDAKAPRSFGILEFNVGQVRRFSYEDGQCIPRWEQQ